MFSIGQHVIHPGQGVCTVVGFRDDTPQPMLLLETKQGHAQTILMYPVAQADRLHAAISQQDAEHLLSHYDELECDTFTERNSSLEETHFKQQPSTNLPKRDRFILAGFIWPNVNKQSVNAGCSVLFERPAIFLSP